MDEGGELPIDLNAFSKTTESAGTKVYLPDNDSGGKVFKVGKAEYSARSGKNALEEVKEFRHAENVALATASRRTKEAIVPQQYVLVEGSTRGYARTARVPNYIEGVPLGKLGFAGIMNLDHENIVTLRSILKDSIKCYLTYGTNYDLSGSDEQDAVKKSRLLNLKRLVFPLRHSVNLRLTENGVKLIDPNVLGKPSSKQSLKQQILQGLNFVSSVVDYVLLGVYDRINQLQISQG